MKEYTIYQLWAQYFKDTEIVGFSSFIGWLKKRELTYRLDPARGVVVQVPEE